MPQDTDAAAALTKRSPNFQYGLWRLRIFFITWLAYGGFYLTRKCFSVAKVGIENDATLIISKTAMGWIDFCYLSAYAIGQFLWGIYGDRFGTRKIVLTGMLLSVVAAVAMGLVAPGSATSKSSKIFSKVGTILIMMNVKIPQVNRTTMAG